MKAIKFLCLFLLCALAFSCKEENIILYENEESGIYFQHGGQTRLYINSDLYYDSLAFSFAITKSTTLDTIVNVRIRTMGKVKDYDRTVKLSIDTEKTSAIQGVHYDADFSNVKILANTSELYFPVKLIRTADMLDNVFDVVLKLEDNENFKVYFNKQKNTNVYTAVGEEIDADRFKLTVSEIYTKPFYWAFTDGSYGASYHFFGPWTVAKYKFINDLMGWTPEDWQYAGHTGRPVQLGRFNTAAYLVRNKLQELANAGTPMREKDGSFMQLGPNYAVDYTGNL